MNFSCRTVALACHFPSGLTSRDGDSETGAQTRHSCVTYEGRYGRTRSLECYFEMYDTQFIHLITLV